MIDFQSWYDLYPRKEAKRDAMKAWGQIGIANQEKALLTIPNHAKRWLALDTQTQFIPLPASWLRGWRFDDEIEIAKPKAPAVQIAWWASEQGCLAKAREVGINARPGESLDQLKGRVAEALKRVA